jgi:hypothetical protein
MRILQGLVIIAVAIAITLVFAMLASSLSQFIIHSIMGLPKAVIF